MNYKGIDWEFASFMWVAGGGTLVGTLVAFVLWFFSPLRRQIENHQKTVDFVMRISNPECPEYYYKVVNQNSSLWKDKEDSQSETAIALKADNKRLKEQLRQRQTEEFEQIKMMLFDLQKQMNQIQLSIKK